MVSQNNAHISDELLTAVNAAEQAEGKTADDLLAEAARRYLENKQLDELVERGRNHAARTGRRPSDAVGR